MATAIKIAYQYICIPPIVNAVLEMLRFILKAGNVILVINFLLYMIYSISKILVSSYATPASLFVFVTTSANSFIWFAAFPIATL